MVTRNSPESRLRAHAKRMAVHLRAMERDRRHKAAWMAPNVKFAIAMDDRTLIVDMPWETVREMSKDELTQYLLEQMKAP